MILKCLIIDDEPLALDLLEDNINKLPFLQLVGRCSNAVEAISRLQAETIDLIFTDIQMPGLSGIQFIQSLTYRPMVIIVTAYERHAVEGFNLDVIDYLLKPSTFERFVKACNKAFAHYQLIQPNSGAEQIKEKDFLFINADYSSVKVVFRDILMVEALKDYLKIVYADNRSPTVFRATMKSFEQALPQSKFIRIHKSYIVNMEYVSMVRKNSIFLGKLELPVSEAQKNKLDELINCLK